MNRTKILLVTTILTLAAGAVPAHASEKALVFRFRGTGVGEDVLDAVTVLMAGALGEQAGYDARSATDLLGDTGCVEPGCAAELARGNGYPVAVTGSVTRLGGKFIIRAGLVNAVSGDVTASAEGTALFEEEIDVVLKRVARSIAAGESMEDSAELGLITSSESETELRRGSFTTGGLRVGFLFPTGESYAGVGRMTAVDLVFQYDLPDYFLAGRSGIRWGGDIEDEGHSAWEFAILDTKMGRYFGRGDFSPFISIGMGLHWLKLEDEYIDGGSRVRGSEDATGLALSVGGGIAAFRTYDFQFQIDVDYIIFFESMGVDPMEESYPKGLLFTFCIKKGGRD